jgi:hypothetical protein
LRRLEELPASWRASIERLYRELDLGSPRRPEDRAYVELLRAVAATSYARGREEAEEGDLAPTYVSDSPTPNRFGMMLKQKLSARDVSQPRLSDLVSCYYAAGRHGYKLFLFEGHVYKVDANGPYKTGFVEADVESL